MNRNPAPAAGFILAGGASRRMGADKALLPAGSGTLLEFVHCVVSAVARPVRIVAPAGRYESLGLEILADQWPGEGPLGGLITALESTNAEWNLVVAVDMPTLDPAILERLLSAASASQSDCLVPTLSGGRRQPLCAVYRKRAAQTLRTHFDAGLRRMMDALNLLATENWPAEEHHFGNVNTPQQWEAIR